VPSTYRLRPCLAKPHQGTAQPWVSRDFWCSWSYNRYQHWVDSYQRRSWSFSRYRNHWVSSGRRQWEHTGRHPCSGSCSGRCIEGIQRCSCVASYPGPYWTRPRWNGSPSWHVPFLVLGPAHWNPHVRRQWQPKCSVCFPDRLYAHYSYGSRRSSD